MKVERDNKPENIKREENEQSFSHLFKTIARDLRDMRKGHLSLAGRVSHVDKTNEFEGESK